MTPRNSAQINKLRYRDDKVTLVMLSLYAKFFSSLLVTLQVPPSPLDVHFLIFAFLNFLSLRWLFRISFLSCPLCLGRRCGLCSNKTGDGVSLYQKVTILFWRVYILEMESVTHNPFANNHINNTVYKKSFQCIFKLRSLVRTYLIKTAWKLCM